MNKFYITTAIDYVNDTIHVGHAFQKIAADVLARYQRIQLGDENVFFLTGTDEYGKKVEKAAQEAKISTKELADKISKSDRSEQDALNISYNRFIRTTDPDHTKAVGDIWRKVKANGDIYLGDYSGLYCEGCEAYYSEEDLVDGHCPFHPNLEIKKVTEKNYFFRWSKYKDFLISLINTNEDFISPKTRRNEMLEFANKIQDIPVSRSNFRWGIPVPDDPNQVIYVWFDALINYVTGVGYLDDKKLFEKFWPADVHILGKDNLRWHALLWPAMLKSADLEIPKTILVNGFLNLDGQKISKSLGNVIRPTDLVKKYGVDGVRYYLLRYTVLTEDSDISEAKLVQAYNSDLANGLGNLTSRIARLIEQNSVKVDETTKLKFSIPVAEAVSIYRFDEALKSIWEQIRNLDQILNEEKPWEDGKEVDWNKYVKIIRQIAFDLKPFLPETSEKIEKQFNATEIRFLSPLFPRLS